MSLKASDVAVINDSKDDQNRTSTLQLALAEATKTSKKTVSNFSF